MIDEKTIPVYQTLSFWDLVEPGSDLWKRTFPFNAPRGRWAFSGRVALHLGLRTLQLPPGSTILVPNYFQNVEIDTLLHNGFKLQFYRINEHLEADLNDLEPRFDDSVSALYIIHYFGWPQPVQQLLDLCQRRDVPLIEDCALSLYSRSADGTWLGSAGEMAIYSVYKTLPLPHGGYVVTRSASKRAPRRAPMVSTGLQLTDLLHQHLRTHGYEQINNGVRAITSTVRRALRWKRSKTVTSGGSDWDARLLDYRASDLVPFLMKSVDPEAVIGIRRRNYTYLLSRLYAYTLPPFTILPDYLCPLFYPVLVNDKSDAMAFMANRRVGTVNLWWDDHRACPDNLAKEVTFLRRHILELPIHQALTLSDLDHVADAMLEYYRGDRGRQVSRAAEA